MSTLAITGGTGFVGARLIDHALTVGHEVRALARKPQAERTGVTWIAGSLSDAPALAELVRGADAVIHVAGVTNAPDRAAFAAGNVEGTRAILAATEAAGTPRFVHVSSLSAREPQLSNYGWSKAEGDRQVAASPLGWTIVRPPAIYGPGDHDMLEMFRLAKRGFVPVPSAGRFSAIHVDDLARLLVALAEAPADRAIFEADDETPGGWDHRDFVRALGDAVGTAARPIPVPPGVLMAAARVARLVQGNRARLTPDRAAYFAHPDWTAAPDRRPPAELWVPAIATLDGLKQTTEWYRAAGLL